MKSLRLICVDDEPLALEQVQLVLSKIETPMSCRFFGSPKRAIEAHREEPADIVISDLKMGSTDGLDLITEMRKFAPDAIYMLLSAQADLQSALIAVNKVRVFRFLTKPAQVDDISIAIVDAIRELNIKKMRTIAHSTLDAIEQQNTPVAAIDLNGKLIYANSPAEEILRDKNVFSICKDGAIHSVDLATTKKFREFLTTLSSSDPDVKINNLFRFSRSNDDKPVVVSAVYFDGSNGGTPHFSLLISDPTRKNIVNPASIATALHLTPSEARVVHGLVTGGGVAEAAKHAGVSLSTARSYLKNVFHKTGVSKQAELVRLAILSAA